MNGMVTVITPTGDRATAFGLCQRWIESQTQRLDNWIIVDDGEIPLDTDRLPDYARYIRREPRTDDPKVTLAINLRAAVRTAVRGDKIIIWEDDEYYAPGYIEEMSKRLDDYEVAGICRGKYYNLPTGYFSQLKNMKHASLAQTGFRRSFLPKFIECLDGDHFIDIRLWAAADKATSILFDDGAAMLYCGMKGLPGRVGIGYGHRMHEGYQKDTPGREVLKRWVPGDYPAYLALLTKGAA